jgi:uncharacterized membrane protein HdeD (DUF308 family)
MSERSAKESAGERGRGSEGDMLAVWVRNWWVPGVRGMVALLYGLLAVVLTGATEDILALLLGTFALIDGALSLLLGLERHQGRSQQAIPLAAGTAGIVMGLLVFFWPDVAGPRFLDLLAVWAFVTAGLEISTAIGLSKAAQASWLAGLRGAGMAVLGLILWHGSGVVLTFNQMIGASIAAVGLLLVLMAARLRGWSRPPRASGA